MNEPGAVVSGDDLDAGRKRGFDLRELGFHAVDDGERVHTVAHNDNAADGLALALPVGRALADVGAKSHGRYVADHDRGPVLGGERYVLKVGQGVQIAETSDHVLRAAQFEQAAAHFIRAGANLVDNRGKRNSVSAELVGVEVDLILPHEAADGGDFGHTRNGRELVAQVPVLKAS